MKRTLIASSVTFGTIGVLTSQDLWLVAAYATGFFAIVKLGADFIQGQTVRGGRS
ncbi:MAG: hypothetical protein ACOYON_01985 [Fimbriimonas sp.]|jgi:hypothetical protein